MQEYHRLEPEDLCHISFGSEWNETEEAFVRESSSTWLSNKFGHLDYAPGPFGYQQALQQETCAKVTDFKSSSLASPVVPWTFVEEQKLQEEPGGFRHAQEDSFCERLPSETSQDANPVLALQFVKEEKWQGRYEAVLKESGYNETDKGKSRKGRPRTRSSTVAPGSSRIVRSKTGCYTCRDRKKKCDERRPSCLNCQKGGWFCKGYSDLALYKRGNKKSEPSDRDGMSNPTEQRKRKTLIFPAQTLSMQAKNLKPTPGMPCFETKTDMLFRRRYISRLRAILTATAGDGDHTVKYILLEMASQNYDLRHSILSLFGKLIDLDSPFGINILQEFLDVDVLAIEEHARMHQKQEQAFNEMMSVNPSVNLTTEYGQIIAQVLECAAESNYPAEHRDLLQHYLRLVLERRHPSDPKFRAFLDGFFCYHICMDQLTYLPNEQGGPNSIAFVYPGSTHFFSVPVDIFIVMTRITNLRNKIRSNCPIDELEAAELSSAIKSWEFAGPYSGYNMIHRLYQVMTWIYLWRTICRLDKSNWDLRLHVTSAVDLGIELLESFRPDEPAQTLLLAPAFVIGCAAFEERQRGPLRQAIHVVKSYKGFRNSDIALLLLEELWRLMDLKSEESWDWQRLASRKKLDFLAT